MWLTLNLGKGKQLENQGHFWGPGNRLIFNTSVFNLGKFISCRVIEYVFIFKYECNISRIYFLNKPSIN